MIEDTQNLPIEIVREYIQKLLEKHILTKNENGDEAVNVFFLKAFTSQEKIGMVKQIKREAPNNDFLSTMIRLGMCLIMFGIKRDELFHSLNIVAISMKLPQCRSNDCERILGWIDYFAPDVIHDKEKMKLQKKLDVLDD